MKFNFKQELGKLTPKVAEGAKIYAFGAGEYWNVICKQYKYMVNINIDECIDGFIDNDPGKQGALYHGLPVCGIEKIDHENSIVIISTVSYANMIEIGKQLNEYGHIQYHSYFRTSLFTELIMHYGYKRILQFKGKHKGQRCFIIGNGPSLLAEDLEKIKNVPAFATNRIYYMFEHTAWRPSYYVISDNTVLTEIHSEIRKKITCPVFYGFNDILGIDEFSLNDCYYYSRIYDMAYKPEPYTRPLFSEEPFFMQQGATVTYDCIQMAVYMGFTEIYLIGIDNSFPLSVKNNGEIVTDDVDWHFSSNYGRHTFAEARIDLINAAYKAAREYCDAHNIKIYNATRGGKLEVFERVDFDRIVLNANT